MLFFQWPSWTILRLSFLGCQERASKAAFEAKVVYQEVEGGAC